MNDILSQLANAMSQLIAIFKQNLFAVLFLLAGLWAIQVINWFLKGRLCYLGIYPRHLVGIPGIVCSPFLHADFSHLFFNSIPLFILMTFMLVPGWLYFCLATASIVILSGILIWLIGRKAIHVGASSLIMGYWAFLLVNTYQHPSMFSIILGILTLYYLGSLVTHLFPAGGGVSWEGHLCGFVAGLVTVWSMPWLISHILLPMLR